MPQETQSGKMGKSSSPVVDRVIQNSKNGQQPVSVPGCTKTAFNKQPVKVG